MTVPTCSACQAHLNPRVGQPVHFSAGSPANYLVLRCPSCRTPVRVPLDRSISEAPLNGAGGYENGAMLPTHI